MTERNRPKVSSSVKDELLVQARRQQIVQASVKLFKQKGFHRSTTREIATAAGFSIGTLYEYVRTKEDVLFLICDHIFNEVMATVQISPNFTGSKVDLERVIKDFFSLIDRMQDEFTIMYQETKSLPKQSMQYVLQKEFEMVAAFENALKHYAAAASLRVDPAIIYFVANQIVVQGHAWAFRKWALQPKYTLDQYIDLQMRSIFEGLLAK